MKKINFLAVVLMALVLAGAGCASFYGTPPANAPQTGTPVINSNTEYFPPTNENTNNPPPITNSNQPLPTAVTVDIKNFSFDPATMTINSGTTITWENYDSAPHQIAGEGFGSSSLGRGEKYSFTFVTAGTYNYHCAIHPSMTGTIIVQ